MTSVLSHKVDTLLVVRLQPLDLNQVCVEVWYTGRRLPTLAAEQEVAHVVAEGAADVAAAVRQGARQAAAVE